MLSMRSRGGYTDVVSQGSGSRGLSVVWILCVHLTPPALGVPAYCHAREEDCAWWQSKRQLQCWSERWHSYLPACPGQLAVGTWSSVPTLPRSNRSTSMLTCAPLISMP